MSLSIGSPPSSASAAFAPLDRSGQEAAPHVRGSPGVPSWSRRRSRQGPCEDVVGRVRELGTGSVLHQQLSQHRCQVELSDAAGLFAATTRSLRPGRCISRHRRSSSSRSADRQGPAWRGAGVGGPCPSPRRQARPRPRAAPPPGRAASSSVMASIPSAAACDPRGVAGDVVVLHGLLGTAANKRIILLMLEGESGRGRRRRFSGGFACSASRSIVGRSDSRTLAARKQS